MWPGRTRPVGNGMICVAGGRPSTWPIPHGGTKSYRPYGTGRVLPCSRQFLPGYLLGPFGTDLPPTIIRNNVAPCGIRDALRGMALSFTNVFRFERVPETPLP
jgi:hypothetical protein